MSGTVTAEPHRPVGTHALSPLEVAENHALFLRGCEQLRLRPADIPTQQGVGGIDAFFFKCSLSFSSLLCLLTTDLAGIADVTGARGSSRETVMFSRAAKIASVLEAIFAVKSTRAARLSGHSQQAAL